MHQPRCAVLSSRYYGQLLGVGSMGKKKTPKPGGLKAILAQNEKQTTKKAHTKLDDVSSDEEVELTAIQMMDQYSESVRARRMPACALYSTVPACGRRCRISVFSRVPCRRAELLRRRMMRTLGACRSVSVMCGVRTKYAAASQSATWLDAVSLSSSSWLLSPS